MSNGGAYLIVPPVYHRELKSKSVRTDIGHSDEEVEHLLDEISRDLSITKKTLYIVVRGNFNSNV